LSLVWGKRAGLTIKVCTSIRHEDLRSPRKHRTHARLIAQTIIGDCVMGITLAQGQSPERSLGKHKLLGYHPQRRFDLLEKWNEELKKVSSLQDSSDNISRINC
ncbi:MAG: hypothetical protein M0T74_17930, partial [Desulfitobacterium hafniense]|nr:hypothetical protein [Desulfitobacterium hafniense]